MLVILLLLYYLFFEYFALVETPIKKLYLVENSIIKPKLISVRLLKISHNFSLGYVIDVIILLFFNFLNFGLSEAFLRAICYVKM